MNSDFLAPRSLDAHCAIVFHIARRAVRLLQCGTVSAQPSLSNLTSQLAGVPEGSWVKVNTEQSFESVATPVDLQVTALCRRNQAVRRSSLHGARSHGIPIGVI